MLFTAQAYTDDQDITEQQQDALARLVLGPRLSHFWLLASALPDDADDLLLSGLHLQLQQLLKLKHNYMGRQDIRADVLREYVPDMPDSWLLPVRDTHPVSMATLEWQLDVAAIRQAARKSVRQQETVSVWPPTSSLLGGVSWSMKLECTWLPASRVARSVCMHVPITCQLAHPAAAGTVWCVLEWMLWPPAQAYLFSNGSDCGFSDYFEVGCMSGGFDEVAWAGKGLPTPGSILLQMIVKDAPL